ncbi:MAG: type II toxin-antitoxin system RelE/ParE family toxin [Nitrosospira sp.]
MPRVIVTEGAGQGLEHCRQFLATKNPFAVKRAAQIIERQFALLETTPDIGRPLPDLPELRELVKYHRQSRWLEMVSASKAPINP